eukprot:3444974-Pyramimonas_sp.AAC.1
MQPRFAAQAVLESCGSGGSLAALCTCSILQPHQHSRVPQVPWAYSWSCSRCKLVLGSSCDEGS